MQYIVVCKLKKTRSLFGLGIELWWRGDGYDISRLWGWRRVELNRWERRISKLEAFFRWFFSPFLSGRPALLSEYLCQNSSAVDQSCPHHRRFSLRRDFSWLWSFNLQSFLFSSVIPRCCFQRKDTLFITSNLSDLFWLEDNDGTVVVIDSLFVS